MSVFNRKYNLLSLLRGYDLTFPYDFSSILLGYGKGVSPSTKYAAQYEKTYTDVDENPVNGAFKKFKEEYVNNETFWKSTDFVIEMLVRLTRYVILSFSPDYKTFFETMEAFLSDLINSKYYITILEQMDEFMDDWKNGNVNIYQSEIPGFIVLKETCRKQIKKYLFISEFYDLTSRYGVSPDENFIQFIVNCLVCTSKTPEDFALNTEKYRKSCTNSIEFDTKIHFSEDLRDTKKKDLYDLHRIRPIKIDFEEEDIGSEDEDYEEPVSKKMKGSGFYNWWW